MKLSDEEVGRILDTVTSVVSKTLGLFSNEQGWYGRTGGYLCVADPSGGDPILRARILEPPEENWKKHFDLSGEKALRVGQTRGSVSSYETRDPHFRSSENLWGRYGGAIWTPQAILAFSGLPELGDEAAMLVSAYELGYLTTGNLEHTRLAGKIIRKSNNPHFARLAYQFPWSRIEPH